MRLLVFGTGAIGGTVGGWIAAHYSDIFFIDQGETLKALREKGITLYKEGHPRQTVHVKTFDSLADAPDADAIILAVKNYSLEKVCPLIRSRFGDTPLIIALQNGVVNQTILPRHFSRVVYGVIGYNAWIDEPGVIGYQKKGPTILGTPHNELRSEMRAVSKTFRLGVETVVTSHLQDTAHCKLILNLTNSLTTLAGHGYREITSIRLFQQILSNLLLEGIQIVRAAGYHECRIGGMPGWAFITASAKLPQFLTLPLFKKNIKKMVRSSMSQDIIQHGRRESELEDINGYLVRLAEQHGVRAPYNRAIYHLCKAQFSKPVFEPMKVEDIWARIQSTQQPDSI